MLTSVGFASHALAAAGYLAFAAYIGRRHALAGPTLWLFVALLLTATWAAAIAGAAASGGTGLALLPLAETLRLAGWIAFLASMLAPSLAKGQRDGGSLQVIIALAVLLVIEAGINAAHLNQPPQTGSFAAVALLFARIATAIGGLVLAHNVYVNALPSERWSIQLLCIAVAALFAYDLNFYTLALLTGAPSIDLAIVRGAVNALVLPMLWLSIRRRGQLRLQLSRNAMFHSLSLGAIGLYLILMSVAAYGLKLVGGDWGRLFQISFLFAAAVLAITVLVSGRFRAWARVTINKNFFTYKYDYRTEWLRFIGTVSQTREGHGDLPMRVVQAVCTIIDSPGGGLFTRNDRGDFELAARWNYRSIGDIRESGNGALAQFLGVRGRIVDLDELRRGSGDYAGLVLPAWAAADDQAWLIVPLQHIGQLAGFILVERALVRRDLNWEDFDLLRTVGRQAASYIAEAGSQAALIEARKFDEFNRRFAFIMHDIKNLVSQLSLVARNAERHADNPEFRADMVKTLQSSVAKMNELLARLSQQNRALAEPAEALRLAPVVEDVVASMRRRHAAIELTLAAADARVVVDPQRIEQVLVHLIQNAIDAGSADDIVRVTLDQVDDWVRIAIADEGCGMSPAFIRSELFQPFRSTKAGGFGIGAYEARESIRAMGGNLEVASREGEGSLFTILLPALNDGIKHHEAAQ